MRVPRRFKRNRPVPRRGAVSDRFSSDRETHQLTQEKRQVGIKLLDEVGVGHAHGNGCFVAIVVLSQAVGEG
jgi:hypothetical protein